LTQYKSSIEKVAAELLVREVLDGEQVRRSWPGLPLEAIKPASPARSVSSHDEETGRRKERPESFRRSQDPLPQE
jgi:hypothetical protein